MPETFYGYEDWAREQGLLPPDLPRLPGLAPYVVDDEAAPEMVEPELLPAMPMSRWDRLALTLSQFPSYERRPYESGGSALGRGLLSGLARGFGTGGVMEMQRREGERTTENQRRVKAAERAQAAALESWKTRQRTAARQADTALGERKFLRTHEEVAPGKFAPIQAPVREKPYRSMTPQEKADFVWKQRNIYRAPVAPTAAKMPSAGEREKLIGDVQVLEQTAVIENLFRPGFVGPAQGRRGAAALASGIGIRPGEADFRGALALYRNAVINQLSGAAVSGSEAIRMKQQIPQETDPPEAFRSKLRQTKQNIARVAKARREIFARTGLDLSDLPPLPGQSVPGVEPTQADRDYVKSLGLER